jgi:hypothetical protein
MKRLLKHRKRLTQGIAVVVVVTVLLVEVIGRMLGLCDPVLVTADDRMEYRCAPNQETWIRGSRILINSVSMRSDEVDPGRSHVLMLGDSVLWGGTVVDQAELASTRVEQALGADKVQVLNASAGSWGPPNLAAYVEKFGTFDAETAVLVLSTQDAADAMTFEPVVGNNSSFPDRKPWSVTLELANRYVPRLIAVMLARGSPPTRQTPSIDAAVIDTVTDLTATLRGRGLRTIVVMHPQRDELDSTEVNAAWTAMVDAARRGGAEVFDARTVYRSHAKNGAELYRDAIHLTVEGQAALADAILQAMGPAVQSESGRGPTTRAG